jgi:mono/diheme cytochrome c family protein
MKAALAALLALTVVLGSQGLSTRDGVYTKDQAARGEALYKKKCASCHGASLEGIGQARALAGDAFRRKWNGQTVGDLFDDIDSTMPADDPGTLAPVENADTIAFILQANQFPASEKELPSDSTALKNIRFEGTAPKQ